MARPKKKNADYFSHDADMRNDPKIKALRRKFGLEGYAVWCMILETLTDADYFEIEWNEMTIELLAGDYDVEPEKLVSLVEYCYSIKLLTIANIEGVKMIFSEKLISRFETVLNRRSLDRKRKTEGFSARKTTDKGVFRTESTQSKVKESKVKESKVKEKNTHTLSQPIGSDDELKKKIAEKKKANKAPKKNLPKVPPKGFRPEVEETLRRCLRHFPDHLHPKDLTPWLDTVDKLERIDKIPFSLIVELVEKIRGDDFWSKNFLSMTKLRKKNNDDIPYIVFFHERFKAKAEPKKYGRMTEKEVEQSLKGWD